MPAPFEMKKLYNQDKIGEFEYGECEYIHNCESIWSSITYGEEDYWRNNMYSTFYCTPLFRLTKYLSDDIISVVKYKDRI